MVHVENINFISNDLPMFSCILIILHNLNFFLNEKDISYSKFDANEK